MKSHVKSLLGRIVFATGLHRRLLRGRAVVVLFHRVDDRFPGDDITCSEREFRDYCAFFARHFTVVPLGEIVRRAAAGTSVEGLLAITFDDGYRDNILTAAPILEAHRLPALFYIATDFIGSEHVPWWDAELPARPEWMTWDQVRELRARGFELGAHTMSHPDLGVVRGDQARREITGCGERLLAETGERVAHFSYPYGRADQMLEENRTLVREAGYASCVSAHGGTVAPGCDPYRLPRIGISPYFVSPWHFGFEALRSAPSGRYRAPVA